jgi:hypothetical protein
LETTDFWFFFRYWEYTNSAWTPHDKLLDSSVYNFFYDANADNTYSWNPKSPQIVSYVALAPKDQSTSLKVCTFQIFGWPYCYADPKTPIQFTTPTILFNSGERKTSIALGTLQTYYDPDLFS